MPLHPACINIETYAAANGHRWLYGTRVLMVFKYSSANERRSLYLIHSPVVALILSIYKHD